MNQDPAAVAAASSVSEGETEDGDALGHRIADLRAIEAGLAKAIREQRIRQENDAETARKDLDAELANRRQETERAIAALETDAGAVRDHHRHMLDQMREQIGETARTHLTEWIHDYKATHEALAALREEAETNLYRALSEDQHRAAREEARIRAFQTNADAARIQAEERNREQAAEIMRLRAREAALQDSLRISNQQWDSLGAESPDAVLARWTQQQRLIETLQNDLAARATVAETQQLHDLVEERARLRGHIAELQDEKQRLERAEMLQMAVRGDYEVLLRRCENLRAQIAVFEQLYASQDAAFKRLSGQVEATVATLPVPPAAAEIRMARLGNLLEPRFRWEPASSHTISERAWLTQIHQRMTASGLHFSARLLDSFHTCLKIAAWSPLTVMSGISGTGKSELPRLYARFGGLHHELVSVRTTWRSPEDIFGFYNFLENRFVAQPMLQAMAQCQEPDRTGGLASQLLLVVLDEMNLAKIEDYLSELLSRWEMRKGEDDVAISFALGSDCAPFHLQLGLNALFVGTVNEDETTKMLSDKVLDRGNLLYFPPPRQFRSRRTLELGAPAKPLAFRQWELWQRAGPDAESEPDLHGHCDAYKTVLESINRYLAGVDRAVGQRVWQAVELYICNHPRVIEERDNPAGLQQAVLTAFEDQIVQRIVPRLRGLSAEGAGETCLHGIADLIDAHASEDLSADFRAAVDASDRGFVWRPSERADAI